jgi:UDP-N-acetylmuramyl pentapeptide synthase
VKVRLTLGWIAGAVGGRLTAGRVDTEVRDVVIDSRVVGPGDLFVAIKGPRFDGHDFVAEVLARGAAAAIVDSAPRKGVPHDSVHGAVIEVGDTVNALQDLAHAVRMAAGTKVIAITGSAGKTTTKETIAAFLERRKTVVKNKGNLNNHIGLPLSLMQVRHAPDVAVMELGMNHAGEISALVAIAEPDVRVWTNVGDAHLGFFASPEAIADAKAEILEGATPSTVLVCNADDPRVRVGAADDAAPEHPREVDVVGVAHLPCHARREQHAAVAAYEPAASAFGALPFTHCVLRLSPAIRRRRPASAAPRACSAARALASTPSPAARPRPRPRRAVSWPPARRRR